MMFLLTATVSTDAARGGDGGGAVLAVGNRATRGAYWLIRSARASGSGDLCGPAVQE